MFHLFQKTPVPDDITDSLAGLDEAETQLRRIRCPLCHWQPQSSSLWCCLNCGHPEYFYEGCGTSWNTFTTKGLCPGCLHQWRYTACLQCAGWSLHDDWYSEGHD